MIIGECPYDDCDGTNSVPMPENSGGFDKANCETCGKVVWTWCSRVTESFALTDKDFHEHFIVDETTKNVTEKALT